MRSLHNLGLVGRIEDIAVSRSQKGKKMGLRVLEALMYVSVQAGCYKVSLFGHSTVKSGLDTDHIK